MVDPKIKYDIEAAVKGEADAEQLSKALQDVGNTLEGDLKKGALDAAAALDTLNEKQGALRNFRQNRVDAQALSAALGDATESVNGLGMEMESAAADAQKMAAAERSSREALEQSKGELQSKRLALKTLREETTGAARSETAYKDAVVGLRESIRQSREEVKTRQNELRTSTRETTNAVNAEAALKRQYEGAIGAAANLSSQLRSKNDAVTQSRDALQALGLTTTNVSEQEKKLQQAMQQARQEAEAMVPAYQQAAAASKASLQLAQSEIDLQNRRLELRRQEQAELVRTAKARDDERAVLQAQNNLRQIEAEQLGMVARAKRAEATAIQDAVNSRHRELAALGPLTQAQLNELRAAENHAKALRQEAAAADQASTRIRQLTSEKRAAAATSSQLSERVSNLTSILGQMASVAGTAFGFRELVTAAAQMETLRSGLTAVTQDANKAGQELEFVRSVAIRIGADITEVGRAFLGLSAATRGTAVEGEPTRRVFEAVAAAMGKAGKSSAETSNALLALSQMASKGVVQSEELRGQLGEALPGALQAAAKGMGLTTAELTRLVEEGKIAAEDLFPALTKGLNELYGAASSAKTLTQELANVKNAFVGMAEDIGDGGGLQTLKFVAQDAQKAFLELSTGFVATGKTIGATVGALVSRDFSLLKETFAEIDQEARDKLAKAALSNDKLKKSIMEGSDEALKAAFAQQQLAAATNASSAAAAKSGDEWLRINNGYGLVLTSVRQQITELEKSVIAREAEGKASIALAQAFGTEKEQRAAQVDAAQANADVMANLAKQRITELETLKAQLLGLKEEAAAQGKLSTERGKQLDDLQKLINLKQQEVDKSVAQVQASRLAAIQTKAEAEAHKDNSGRVKELGDAYEAARRQLELTRSQQAQGLKTQDDVKNAELEAGKAAYLYRDALRDQVEAIEAKRVTQVSELQTTVSLLQTQKNLASQSEQLAALMGNEVGVRRAKIEQLEIDIKLTKAKADVARVEAEGAIEVANATMAELKAKDQLTPLKEAEINASIRLAKAKMAEADAIRKSAEVAQQELTRLRNNAGSAGNSMAESMKKAEEATNAVGDAARNAAGGYDQMAQSAEAAAAAAQKAAEQQADEDAKKSGYTNKDNMGHYSRNAGGLDWTGVWNDLKGRGIDDETARKIASEFFGPNGESIYFSNPGQKKYGGNTMSDALGRAAAQYFLTGQDKVVKAEQERKAAEDAKKNGSGQTTPTTSTGSGGQGGVDRVVNIYIGGATRAYPIPTNSVGEMSLREIATAVLQLIQQDGKAAGVL